MPDTNQELTISEGSPFWKAKALAADLFLHCGRFGFSALIIIGEEVTPEHVDAHKWCQGKHQQLLLEQLKPQTVEPS